MSDEARRLILARRARFVAAAMVAAGATAGLDACSNAQPCLSLAPADTGPYEPPDAAPQACLSPRYEPDAAGDAAGDASDASDASDAEEAG